MKNICLFTAFAAVLAIVSCNKESALTPESEGISIKVGFEQPVMDPATKMSISESGSAFSLLFDGAADVMRIGNTTNTTTSEFSTTSSGASATYTGTLPKITDAETTDYVGIVSTFGSVTGTNIRGAIAAGQLYNGASVGKSAFLAGRTDDCTVGTLTSMSLNTINAFLKLSLKKGNPAPGATHTYTHMYVKDIVIESVAEEQIAGKFAVSKTGADWYKSYVVDTGIADAEKSSSITLDCTNGGENAGVELSDSAEDFYIALAFGDYAQGLKVTINVQNAKGGDAGKMIGYIQNSSVDKSYSFARNKIVAMPELTVSPVDAVTEIICWSENWNGGTADQTPETYLASSGHSTVVYHDEAIAYTQSTNATKLYAETVAGGASPELMLRKKENSINGIWTISGIPTAGASTLLLTYKSNNTKAVVTCSTAGTTVTGTQKDYTISTGGASTITLVFTNSSSTNSRIDDIVLKVKNDQSLQINFQPQSLLLTVVVAIFLLYF